jgi:hypothetical protein
MEASKDYCLTDQNLSKSARTVHHTFVCDAAVGNKPLQYCTSSLTIQVCFDRIFFRSLLGPFVSPRPIWAGCQWYHWIYLALCGTREKFQTNWRMPHPVRGIKLLREPCFYYLQTVIDSQ